jgi:prophage regulatory protein
LLVLVALSKEGADVRFIRTKDVLGMIGVSRSTLWRMVRAGRFPKRISISARAAGHVYEDVQAWMAARAASLGNAGPASDSTDEWDTPGGVQTNAKPDPHSRDDRPTGSRRRRGRA